MLLSKLLAAKSKPAVGILCTGLPEIIIWKDNFEGQQLVNLHPGYYNGIWTSCWQQIVIGKLNNKQKIVAIMPQEVSK